MLKIIEIIETFFIFVMYYARLKLVGGLWVKVQNKNIKTN